jgi:hypothetical protein
MNPLDFLLPGHKKMYIGTHFDTGRGKIRRRLMHEQTLQSQPGETLRGKVNVIYILGMHSSSLWS